MGRREKVERKTTETDVSVEIDLDGKGDYSIDTSIPFFDHMLSLFAKHGLFDLSIRAEGDTSVDFHHTVEDVGICLGEAIGRALGEKRGIRRYGHATIPMMEALASVVVDLGGRPYLVYNVTLAGERVGNFDTELVEEFLRALSNTGRMDLHVNLHYGTNTHHSIEAIFKALGRAIDEASRIDERMEGIPSTKGKL